MRWEVGGQSLGDMSTKKILYALPYWTSPSLQFEIFLLVLKTAISQHHNFIKFVHFNS